MIRDIPSSPIIVCQSVLQSTYKGLWYRPILFGRSRSYSSIPWIAIPYMCMCTILVYVYLLWMDRWIPGPRPSLSHLSHAYELIVCSTHFRFCPVQFQNSISLSFHSHEQNIINVFLAFTCFICFCMYRIKTYGQLCSNKITWKIFDFYFLGNK